MTLPKIIRFSRTRGAPVEPLLQQRVLTRIVECHTHHGGSMPVPTVSFDLRGKTAGQAFLSKHHIRLNGQLLNENPDDFIHQTVGHEWAHLLCHYRHGPRVAAHGKEWKLIMVALGLNPERCHTYDTTRSTVRRTTRKKPTGISIPKQRVVVLTVPPGLPASDTLWAYAEKMAKPYGIQVPPPLRANRDWFSVDRPCSETTLNRSIGVTTPFVSSKHAPTCV